MLWPSLGTSFLCCAFPPFQLIPLVLKKLQDESTNLIPIVGELQAFSMVKPFLMIYPDQIVLKVDPGFLPKALPFFNRSKEIVLPTFCSSPSSPKKDVFTLWK